MIMFWSKLCKSNRNCAWNLAFISCTYLTFCMEYVHVLTCSLWIGIFQRALYTRSKNTIYRTGKAVVSTITRAIFVLILTQTHCPVCRLLETFWTFTSLVVLWLESIWTITMVTSWTIDTQMAAVVFNILIAFIDIWETPNWNTVKPLLGGPPIKRTPSIKRTL